MASEMAGWVKANTFLADVAECRQPCIQADVLYGKLGLDQSNFSRWQKDKIGSLKLKEGKDFEYSSLMTKTSRGGRPSKVAVLTMRAAIQAAATTLESKVGLALLNAMSDLLQRYQEADPSLAQDVISRQTDPAKLEAIHRTAQGRIVAVWRRQGKSEAWIQSRLESTLWRTMFTDCLAAHGVEGMGYPDITNGMYDALLGMTAGEIKAARLVPKSSPARDGLTMRELAKVQYAETLARCDIEDADARGNSQCRTVCVQVARRVAAV